MRVRLPKSKGKNVPLCLSGKGEKTHSESLFSGDGGQLERKSPKPERRSEVKGRPLFFSQRGVTREGTAST